MSMFKRLCLAVTLIPTLAFADPYAASFNVSTNCYGAFRVSIGMLPYLADELNAHAGTEVLKITNVKVPVANPSTYSLTIEKSLRDYAVGDYQLEQEYVNGTLFLRLAEVPDTFEEYHAAHMWKAVGRFFDNCLM